MDAVAGLTLSALNESPDGALAHYSANLIRACAAHPPPYGTASYGQTFRRYARDPQWLVRALTMNAKKEGEGSSGLWTLAGGAHDPVISEQLQVHAKDEARHARIYGMLLDAIFPDAMSNDARAELDGFAPRYPRGERPAQLDATPEHVVLDGLIQINIAEIRTRINQELFGPVLLAWCPPEGRTRVGRLMDSILTDETRHIRYTALLIERAMRAGHGAFVERVTAKRLAQFNEITLIENGEAETAFADS